MPLSWRPFLASTSDTRVPPLLIAQSFTSREYEVYLTDLSHLWSEKLDRRAINKRSLMADTSIDPTEDDEQMKLLLSKLELGLNCGKEVDVTLSIRQDGRGEHDVDGLDIKISMDLPKPFEPLKWTFEMISCRPGQLVSYFTLPLIQAQNQRRKELESLIEILMDKDHVIQKLADKLEASGTELGQVFPSAAGKGGRKLTRKTIEERVRGLAAFDQVSWKKEVHDLDLDSTAKDVKEIIEGVRAPPPKLVLPGGGNDVPISWGNWWQQLRNEVVQISTPENENQAEAIIQNTPAGDDEEQPADDGEEVEVPGTPPPASQKSQKSLGRHSRTRHIVDEDETDDEDLDAPSQPQPNKVPDSFRSPEKKPTKAPAKKIGGIGGKAAASNARSFTPPPAQPVRSSQSQTVRDDDETTEGEGDFEEAQPKHRSPEKTSSQKRPASPTPPPADVSPKKTPRKGLLGKIGGKKTSPTPEQEEATEAHGSKMPSRSKPVLGHVGGKKDGDDDDQRGRFDEIENEEEARRETSAEARQRRKKEMQERLEMEAAKPKKKRKVF